MTCRCNDLRRELSRLLRAVKRDQCASLERRLLIPESDVEWPEDFDFEELDRADDEELAANKSLRRAMRRARALLRETKKS